MTRRAAKMETEEELQARERWRERLKNIPEPELADEATLARFETALKEYRAEKAALEAREERLREIRQAAGAQDRTGFTRVGALIPAEYMPKGDAYEDPDDDVPPPPEVS